MSSRFDHVVENFRLRAIRRWWSLNAVLRKPDWISASREQIFCYLTNNRSDATLDEFAVIRPSSLLRQQST